MVPLPLSGIWNLQVALLICDIEALENKVNALAEVSHANNADIYNTYATVLEVNDNLTNYVQVKDLKPAADLSGYGQKDDLSYKTYRDIVITQDEDIKSVYYVEFVNGMNIKGSVENVNGITINFDIILQLDSIQLNERYSVEFVIDGETYTCT